jgi:hypothetical protein
MCKAEIKRAEVSAQSGKKAIKNPFQWKKIWVRGCAPVIPATAGSVK